MSEIYKGFAQQGQEKELLKFLDKVFTRIRVRTVPYFMTLLPKLYKKEYDPCANNLVIRDKKEFHAAVGIYMLDYICGEGKLLMGGIGNVAVSKKFRGKGYMKELMNDSFDICKERGADLMVLGGQRQRYNYFGYERVGVSYEYKVNKTNLRHALKGADAQGFEVKRIKKDDKEYLAKIYALRKSMPIHIECKEEALFDVLCSWLSRPYVILENGQFAGYFIRNRLGDKIEELRLLDNTKLSNAVCVIFQAFMRGSFKFEVSTAEKETNVFFRFLCENADVIVSESYLIMDYRKVLEVLMQNSGTAFADGVMTMHINGYADEENLRICVENGQVSIIHTDDEPECTLGHLEATRAIFDPISPERDELPPLGRAWFPLPLFAPKADMV